MRPATLAEAIQRIVDGTTQEKALPEFLDTFYLAPTAESRLGAQRGRAGMTDQSRSVSHTG